MARFLIHRGGPLLPLFRDALQPHEIVDADGSQDPAQFDMLIIDGGSIGADMPAAATSAKKAVDADKPVLVLTPGPSHKAALMEAGALRIHGSGSSLAFLIDPWHDQGGRLRFRLAEQFSKNQFGGRIVRTSAHQTARGLEEGPSDAFDVAPGVTTVTDVSRFMERVKRAVARETVADDTNPDTTQPPTNIPTGLYDVTPQTVYIPVNPSGPSSDGYTPPSGTDYVEGLITLGVYYDNTSFGTPSQPIPVQWLFVENQGHMYTNGLEATGTEYQGWSNGALTIQGTAISSSTLTSPQSSPNSVSSQSSYTADTSFTVGLSAGTDGINASASYSIGDSVTYSLSDWNVTQNSPDWWTFAQVVPFNGATAPGSFPSGMATSGGLAGLPSISTGTFAYDTQTVWVQNPATQTNNSITYTVSSQFWFGYEPVSGLKWHAYAWTYTWNVPYSFTIPFASAWPTST